MSKCVRFAVTVVRDRHLPQWSATRMATEIVSNFEYEGFAATARAVGRRSRKGRPT